MGNQCVMGTEVQSGKTKVSGEGWLSQLRNTVTVLHATELCIYKWLRWEILCYVYFTPIRINKKTLPKVCRIWP